MRVTKCLRNSGEIYGESLGGEAGRRILTLPPVIASLTISIGKLKDVIKEKGKHSVAQ